MKLDIKHAWEITDSDGENSYIMGDNICAFINDCATMINNARITPDFMMAWGANISATLDSRISTTNWMPDEIQCPIGMSKNVEGLSIGSKLMVFSSRDIEPGEELFLWYGNTYWYTRAFKYLETGTYACQDCVQWFKTPV